MTIGDPRDFAHAYLEQWLETSRLYLFADQETPADAPEKEFPVSEPGSSGARERFISRVRGKLLRLLRRTGQYDGNPLLELEHAFYFQVSFISRHPDVPRRLLGWLSQGGDNRLRRRIQMVIAHYESRLCRMIERARRQGLIRDDIEPQTAASLFVGMIQRLALGMNADPRRRELLLHEAVGVFALYRAGLVFPSK